MLEQDPAAGTPLAEGSRVTLTVAKRAGPAAEDVQAHAAAVREAERVACQGSDVGCRRQEQRRGRVRRSSGRRGSTPMRWRRTPALEAVSYEVRAAATRGAPSRRRKPEKAIAAARDAAAGASAPGVAINPDTVREARAHRRCGEGRGGDRGGGGGKGPRPRGDCAQRLRQPVRALTPADAHGLLQRAGEARAT
ncbi:MAG: PASTA domain-containing protein [Comamonadaceae bacterium]|nr:PASTA domain-containing protein [Comamonadaceae bacterium]